MTTPVVLDASAGVEIALHTARGKALARLLPADAALWAPEHYYALELAAGRNRQPCDAERPPGRLEGA